MLQIRGGKPMPYVITTKGNNRPNRPCCQDTQQHGDPDRHDDEALEDFNRALQQAVDAVDWSQPF